MIILKKCFYSKIWNQVGCSKNPEKKEGKGWCLLFAIKKKTISETAAKDPRRKTWWSHKNKTQETDRSSDSSTSPSRARAALVEALAAVRASSRNVNSGQLIIGYELAWTWKKYWTPFSMLFLGCLSARRPVARPTAPSTHRRHWHQTKIRSAENNRPYGDAWSWRRRRRRQQTRTHTLSLSLSLSHTHTHTHTHWEGAGGRGPPPVTGAHSVAVGGGLNRWPWTTVDHRGT